VWCSVRAAVCVSVCSVRGVCAAPRAAPMLSPFRRHFVAAMSPPVYRLTPHAERRRCLPLMLLRRLAEKHRCARAISSTLPLSRHYFLLRHDADFLHAIAIFFFISMMASYYQLPQPAIVLLLVTARYFEARLSRQLIYHFHAAYTTQLSHIFISRMPPARYCQLRLRRCRC